MRKNTAGLRDYIGGSWRACVSMLILSLVPAVSLLQTARVDGEPWVSDPSIVSTPLLLRLRRKSHKCVASSTSSTLVSTHVSMQLNTDMAACTTCLHTCTRSWLPHAQLNTQSTSAGERASAIPGQKRGAL